MPCFSALITYFGTIYFPVLSSKSSSLSLGPQCDFIFLWKSKGIVPTHKLHTNDDPVCPLIAIKWVAGSEVTPVLLSELTEHFQIRNLGFVVQEFSSKAFQCFSVQPYHNPSSLGLAGSEINCKLLLSLAQTPHVINTHLLDLHALS